MASVLIAKDYLHGQRPRRGAGPVPVSRDARWARELRWADMSLLIYGEKDGDAERRRLDIGANCVWRGVQRRPVSERASAARPTAPRRAREPREHREHQDRHQRVIGPVWVTPTRLFSQ